MTPTPTLPLLGGGAAPRLRQLTEEIATDHHGPLRRAFFIEEPMAATSFPYCEKTVLAFEGGKVNNPNDPGGRAAIIWRLRQFGTAF